VGERPASSTSVGDLPEAQRRVIAVRDIEGWSAAAVCDVLDVSDTNQRVLLHRARSKVRRSVERYLAGESRPA
jgi:RNA polymerase sigma-70 factor (ECF subfamily)